MKKLYLHIGTEKTGTTTIQDVLFHNKECLQREGFHFLQSAGGKNNRELPSYCMEDDHYDDFFANLRISTLEQKNDFRRIVLRKLNEEIDNLPSSIHSVIISSEHFHSRTVTQQEVENVHRLLSSYFKNITIICYVREQSATAVSLYSTTIKSGQSASLKEVLSNCTPDNPYYNYQKMLSTWGNVFGKENLRVRKFERSSFHNNDLIDDFFNTIDGRLIASVSKEIDSKNESLTVMGQYLGRAVNQAQPKYLDNGFVNPRRIKAINEIYRSFRGRGETVSTEDYERIYAAFSESNIKLNQEFLHDTSEENCFIKQTPKPQNINSAVLQEDELGKLADVLSIVSSPSLNIPDHSADFLKNLAISMARIDIYSAVKLMKLAHMAKPQDTNIKRRLSEYELVITEQSILDKIKRYVYKRILRLP